ncbi:prenyltransferase/squalene oxidase repeat-containing protein [Streptomyces sp. NPDC046215]|uniref:Squalene cyclase C-terminal domain-containing protein n=1 Tax=Streptomyces stramineus TaxID=173861 RepID=A0ABN0ZKS6_9ACTN
MTLDVPLGRARQSAFACRHRLVRHLGTLVGPDGALAGRCDSRILESALFLALVRKHGSPGAETARLVRYLRGASATDGWQPLLAAAALGTLTDGGRATAAARLRTFDHFTGARKRALLSTCLALCGVLPYDRRVAAAPLPHPDRVATWTRLALLATRVLHAHGTGQAAQVPAGELGELRWLMRAGSTRDIWEGNLLVHLLALHALHALRPDDRQVGEGLRVLASRQNADGGLPFTDSHDVFLTAKAGLVLARACYGYRTVRRMGDFVAAAQRPDGGWPYASGVHQTDVDSTAVCLEFLRAADPGRYAAHLALGEAQLCGMAGARGGFPTYRPGDPPEAEMTAGALIALSPGRPPEGAVLEGAAVCLLDQQCRDGTWPRSWTISESSVIERAVHALTGLPAALAPSLAPRVGEALRRAVARLRRTQNPDGGWGQAPRTASDVISTARAVAALTSPLGLPAGPVAGPAVARGRAWLVAAQQADGSYSGPPDQVGPRPIPYEVPALASIHALAALTARQPAGGGPPPRR